MRLEFIDGRNRAMFGLLKGLFGGSSNDKSASARTKAKAISAAELAAAAQSQTFAKVKLKRVDIKRRFTILAETAQGSMSKVYKAIDNEQGRTVCLKLQDAERTQAALARASANRPSEGELGQRVSHPNVCKTFDFGLSRRGEYFLVMEFIDGVSLTAARASRPLTFAEKLEMLAQAAEGLAAVHAAGIIHHDIGPKNFLVNAQGHVKLIDFGLAVPNTPEFRKPGNRTGTLQYMAPEVIRREAKDERLDIFSYGAMAFEFLTLRLPFEGGDTMQQMLQRINIEPMDPAKANPKLPPELCDLLRKLLARKPADRWPRIASVPKILRDLAETYGQPVARKRRDDDLDLLGANPMSG